ncbi:MAG TPA: PIG-L family deacetylase [Verrucomicrobiae bacterium]|nr:PIG-L family deacetylase [Verrucomicrobiae bacterium]
MAGETEYGVESGGGRRAMAICAHPDDIEFVAAGTLLLLKREGFEIHYMNLLNGDCGSEVTSREETARIREGEGRRSAEVLGAVFHPSLCGDLVVTYDIGLLRRLAAVVREVRPAIMLTHYLEDYMEDHMTTARLVTSAVFGRACQNFATEPPRGHWTGDCALYHAMPTGLCDRVRRRIRPGAYADTTSVHDVKRRALESHESQRAWLDSSQGLGCYVSTMDAMSEEVGRMSGRFRHAEGWTRHLHRGYTAVDEDPLTKILGARYFIDPEFEKLTQ